MIGTPMAENIEKVVFTDMQDFDGTAMSNSKDYYVYYSSKTPWYLTFGDSVKSPSAIAAIMWDESPTTLF